MGMMLFDFIIYNHQKHPFYQNAFKNTNEIEVYSKLYNFEEIEMNTVSLFVYNDPYATNLSKQYENSQYFIDSTIFYYFIEIDNSKTKIYTKINHKKGYLLLDNNFFFSENQIEDLNKKFGKNCKLIPSKNKDIFFIIRQSSYDYNYTYNVVTKESILLTGLGTPADKKFDFRYKRMIVKLSEDYRDPFNDEYYEFDENGFDVQSIKSPILKLRYY